MSTPHAWSAAKSERIANPGARWNLHALVQLRSRTRGCNLVTRSLCREWKLISQVTIRLKTVRNISHFSAAPSSAYLGLHCFGVLDEVPVLSVHAVGYLKLLHEGAGLGGGHAVPAASPLDNDALDVLWDTQVHLQPLLPWLGLGDTWKPARTAAHQAGHAGGPVVASDGGGRDLRVRDEAREHPQQVGAGRICKEGEGMSSWGRGGEYLWFSLQV